MTYPDDALEDYALHTLPDELQDNLTTVLHLVEGLEFSWLDEDEKPDLWNRMVRLLRKGRYADVMGFIHFLKLQESKIRKAIEMKQDEKDAMGDIPAGDLDDDPTFGELAEEDIQRLQAMIRRIEARRGLATRAVFEESVLGDLTKWDLRKQAEWINEQDFSDTQLRYLAAFALLRDELDLRHGNELEAKGIGLTDLWRHVSHIAGRSETAAIEPLSKLRTPAHPTVRVKNNPAETFERLHSLANLMEKYHPSFQERKQELRAERSDALKTTVDNVETLS